MGVPTSEVGYTAAMPRREDHEGPKEIVCEALLTLRIIQRDTVIDVRSASCKVAIMLFMY